MEEREDRARLTVPELGCGMPAMRVSTSPERFVYGDADALGWLRERLEAKDASGIDEPIRPGQPGYDDEHGDQGKQEERIERYEDERRGRAFLERVYGAEQGDRDCYEAAGALYGVLAYGVEQIEPSDVSDSSAAALGRVLRESA